jgi:hypothetical protein
MMIGDLVVVDDIKEPGLVFGLYPTIGTDIKMVEVFWASTMTSGLYTEKLVDLLNSGVIS